MKQKPIAKAFHHLLYRPLEVAITTPNMHRFYQTSAY
jgi:hypothetical protein